MVAQWRFNDMMFLLQAPSRCARALWKPHSRPHFCTKPVGERTLRTQLATSEFEPTFRALPGTLICLKTLVPEMVLFDQPGRENSDVSSPKLQVPAELREVAEKTIEQAEKAFGMFLDAAKKSIESIPHPTTEMSKKALSLTEQSMKVAFDHAKKVVQANDLQKVMQIQSEFLKNQFTDASQQIRKITEEVMSAAKETTKEKL